ncbi:hypothetical protein ACIA49_04810 [Kribbella sp. NPDC051587]|uniref:hypothetical protein n=1 Tax=Kribbella sp. NPDC051587 TaxID=3364119 RepID=UPI0037BA7F0D
MSSPSATTAAPKRTLIWIALGCFVVGLALTAFFVVRIVTLAPVAPQVIGADATPVTLDEKGMTIYSSIPVLEVPCRIKDAQAGDVPVVQPHGTEQITVNGDSWYVVARSENPVPAGDYVVTCTDKETSATYAAGPRSTVAGFILSIFGAIGSVLLFGALGGVLLVIGLVRRRPKPVGRVPGYAPPPGSPAPPGANTFPPPPPYQPGPNPDRPQDR